MVTASLHFSEFDFSFSFSKEIRKMKKQMSHQSRLKDSMYKNTIKDTTHNNRIKDTKYDGTMEDTVHHHGFHRAPRQSYAGLRTGDTM